MTRLAYTWRTFTRELTLIAVAVAFCLPLYLLVVISLKSTPDAVASPLTIPTHPLVSNYSDAWSQAGQGGLAPALMSSLIITVGSVVALIGIGSLASYAIARRGGRLGTSLYVLFLLGIIIPFQLGIVPLYVVMSHLHLIGSWIGMIILYTGLLMPLTVFLYTGFIRTLPTTYEEAAEVDGARFFRRYYRVIFPLLSPITGTVAILTGMIVWNDFFTGLIFLSGTDRETLPVAIYSFAGGNVAQWGKIFAAIVITLAPVLAFFLFAQRHLIKGFTGGVRG